MSPLDEYLKECDRSCLVNIGEDCNCGRDSAIQELADLRARIAELTDDNRRLKDYIAEHEQPPEENDGH